MVVPQSVTAREAIAERKRSFAPVDAYVVSMQTSSLERATSPICLTLMARPKSSMSLLRISDRGATVAPAPATAPGAPRKDSTLLGKAKPRQRQVSTVEQGSE